MRLKVTFLVLILLLVVPISAQETPPITGDIDTSAITDDMVNEVARQLYCPVCENIPLDTCGTAACQDWREEVRLMLAVGMSEEEIVDNFVIRFGDRVVGTPKDPVLRALSLYGPLAMMLIGILIAGWTVFNWKKRSKSKTKVILRYEDNEDNNDPYLDMLERDLKG